MTEILTKPEYDELVEWLSNEVFDMFAEDDEIREFSLDVIDRALEADGTAEDVIEDVKDRIARTILFSQEFSDLGAGMVMDPMTAGSIVKHGDGGWVSRSDEIRDRLDISRGTEKATVSEAALVVLWNDVKTDVFDRMRSSTAAREEAADA